MPQPAGRVQAVAPVLPGSGVADERVQRVPVEGGLDRAVGALDRFDIVDLSGANEYGVKPLALVSTVAPPIFAVFRLPAAAAM